MYVADMSAFCGHGAGAGRRGGRPADGPRATSSCCPTEDALAVAEHLAARYGMPKWQFTLSATQANTEVIRLARELTGRDAVLAFDGKYHGELRGDAGRRSRTARSFPRSRGLPPEIAARARIVPFNDAEALEAALAPGDVAVVLAEPAMTNAGFLLPEPGFHEALRRADAGCGNPARDRRDPLAGVRRTPAFPASGAWSRTSSPSASRSPPECR